MAAEFQQLIESTYGRNDRQRGVPATVAWLAEEVGELAQAVRKGTPERAARTSSPTSWPGSPRWPTRSASTWRDAVDRYADGCPRCAQRRARCP